jgi:hypothetical protein
MMYLKYSILFISFVLFSHVSIAQDDEEEINVVGFRFLNYSNDLPEDILQSKSVVFVSVPPISKSSSERGDWKSFASEAHTFFKQIGVDAIAYYYLDDIFASPEVSAEYAEQLASRQVKYIIVLSKVFLKIKNKESLRYVIAITPFSNDSQFIANGQKAYKDQNKDLEKAMKKIYSITIRKDYVKTNNLILDNPEFFGGIPLFSGRRMETFPEDLRADKLAVPGFQPAEIPEDRPGGVLNNRIAKEVEKSNESVEQLNLELNGMFAGYPYKYGLVDYTQNDRQLIRDGYLYILLRAGTSGRSLKEMLGYETLEAESDYITVKKKPDGTITLRTIPADAPVFKYYIRSLVRDEVYVGESWDADETWQDALKNYMDAMVEMLKK